MKPVPRSNFGCLSEIVDAGRNVFSVLLLIETVDSYSN